MNYLTKFEEMEGKTITKIHRCYNDSKLLLRFSDDSLIVIGIEKGWERGDEELEIHKESDLDDYIKLDLGILTQEEYEARKRAKAQKRQETTRLVELRKLAELKKKYESEA